MKSEEARKFVRTMEKEYNAHNKMINSTIAHQAVRMAEIELTQKAISAFDAACSDCGQLCSCLDCSFRKDFIKNLNNK